MERKMSKVVLSVFVAMMLAMAIMVVSPLKASAADADLTVHFQAPAEWTEVYSHTWGGYSTSWPGEEMTEDANNSGWYNIGITSEAAVSFVFNNNGAGEQTADITDVALGEAWITVGEADADGHLTATVATTAPSDWSGAAADTTADTTTTTTTTTAPATGNTVAPIAMLAVVATAGVVFAAKAKKD